MKYGSVSFLHKRGAHFIFSWPLQSNQRPENNQLGLKRLNARLCEGQLFLGIIYDEDINVVNTQLSLRVNK